MQRWAGRDSKTKGREQARTDLMAAQIAGAVLAATPDKTTDDLVVARAVEIARKIFDAAKPKHLPDSPPRGS
jgi:hypothetical protein